MKTKSIILCAFVIALSSFNAFADSVVIKAPEINGKVILNSENLKLTDWQAVMSCHFDYKGDRKESIRYPQTIIRKIENTKNEYSLFIKKGSLSEFLPNWKLLTCAYKIILLGKNTDLDRTIMGEIYLLGQEHGQMDETELGNMRNREYVAKVLEDKTRALNLSLIAGEILAE